LLTVSLPGGLGEGWLRPVLVQGFLDPSGAVGSDALVDGECLLQAVQPFAVGAVPEVGLADSFEGACFLQRRADVAGDGQCLGVTLTGPAGGRGPRGKFAEAV
jgi:hypothetical protein